MKIASLFALMILGASASAFADAPSQTDLIQSLDSYYAGNSTYQGCVQQLQGAPNQHPESVPVAYHVRLSAAAFAEGISTDCK